MDADTKRLLLAIVLSVAVMWIWTLWLAPKRPAKAPAPQKPATQKAQKAPAPTPAPGPKPVKLIPASSTGRLVKVDTPLVSVVLDSRGAVVRKVVLKRYTRLPEGKGGPLVLLDITPKEPGAMAWLLPKAAKELATANYSCSATNLNLKQSPASVVFSLSRSGLKVTKTYTFDPKTYAFKLQVELVNTSGKALEITPELWLREYLNKAEANRYAFTGLQMYIDDKLVEEDKGDLEDGVLRSGALEWAGLAIPYFLEAVVPHAKGKMAVRGWLEGGAMAAAIVHPLVSLGPGAKVVFSYTGYFGPKDLDVLEPLGHHLAAAVDFGWFDFIAKPMLAALKALHRYVGNYGLAIIIITIFIKILFWPLTRKSYKSMKQMQKLQPQIARIREKYKDDKQRMNAEIMQLYKTYKVNPMGGCLPMIVQIPVFIAFYKVLGASIELRHAPFILWINDLSAPDRLPIGIHIPWVGDGIPVLTLLMGVSMFIQQKMTPAAGDPTQQKIMMLMPVIFTVMFINFPSGLVLYWLVNNLLSIAQQWWTNRATS